MRCQYCGSTLVHPDTQHKQFSTGKAAAGAVTFGLIGAAAGFVGKDIKGYKCGACGAFMEKAMDLSTEMSIDSAIGKAESGNGRELFDYFKKQYPNIQANIPITAAASASPSIPVIRTLKSDASSDEAGPTIKGIQRCNQWLSDCPVFVEQIILHTSADGDSFALKAYNQAEKSLRSAYFHATAYDDTGDKLSEADCVYQNVGVKAGEMLPSEKNFPLGTELAYRVELVCDKVAMEDGSVWRRDPTAAGFLLSEQEELTAANFPRLKYIRADLKKNPQLSGNAPLYLPVEHDGFWQCICGHPAKAGEMCPYCGEGQLEWKELLSQERLCRVQLEAVKARAAARAKETMALRERATQRQKESIYQQKEAIYQQAAALQAKDTEESLTNAIELFLSQSDFKDSSAQADACKKRIEELRQERAKQIEAENRRREEEKQFNKKIMKISGIAGAVAVAVIAIVLIVTQIIIPKSKYSAAEKLLNEGDYAGAITAFEALGDYKNSADMVLEAQYRSADTLLQEGSYTEAISAFEALGDYKDAAERVTEAENAKVDTDNAAEYAEAVSLQENGETARAAIAFGSLGDYQDAKERSMALWEEIARISPWDTISTGLWHTVGLNSDGTVVATGYDEYGQCDVNYWTDIMAVSAGGWHTVGLKVDATAVAKGCAENGQCGVHSWTDIVAVSAGVVHTVGLKSDGIVVTAGDNNYGQCNVDNWADIVAVSAGGYHTTGLKSDGKVVAVGDNNYNQCDVDNWTDIVAVSAGRWHTVGLKSDGKVVAVGNNDYGQCDVNDWADIVAVSAGTCHTVGLKSDGTVIAIGENNYGQCGISDWTDIVAVSAGEIHTVGMKSDGTMVAVGGNDDGQCDVSGWTDIKIPG